LQPAFPVHSTDECLGIYSAALGVLTCADHFCGIQVGVQLAGCLECLNAFMLAHELMVVALIP
ncbi:hypothetical protein T4A_856, partial [Trichinella pseudospiralis]